MRVLMANLFYRMVGGAERYMFTLQRLLESRGHHVIPFATRDPRNEPTPYSLFFPEGVTPPSKVAWWKRLTDMQRYVHSDEAAQKMDLLLQAVRPDVVHLHTITYRLTPSILEPIVRRGIPIVQTLHGYKPVCPVTSMLSNGKLCDGCGPGRFHKVLLRRCNEGKFTVSLVNYVESAANAGRVESAVARFHAPSRFCRDMMVRFDAIPAGRLEVRPYALDLGAYRPSEERGEYALYFGRLSPEKGVETLLAACPRDVPLVVAGDGPLSASLRAAAPRVRFTGFLDGEPLRDLVRGARFVVVPSVWHENYPLAAMEAFALGRPVIGTRCGGIPEIVEEGVTGRLVPPGDVAELASALREMWELDPRAMGGEARRFAETRFDPDAHHAWLVDFYRRAGAAVGERAAV